MRWLEWPMNQKCDIYEKTASKVFCSSAVKCTISKSNSNLLHIKFIVDFFYPYAVFLFALHKASIFWKQLELILPLD